MGQGVERHRRLRERYHRQVSCGKSEPLPLPWVLLRHRVWVLLTAIPVLQSRGGTVYQRGRRAKEYYCRGGKLVNMDGLEDFFADLLEFVLCALPAPKIKHKKKWIQKIVNFIIALFWYIGILVICIILLYLIAKFIAFIINLIVQWYSDWYISSITK